MPPTRSASSLPTSENQRSRLSSRSVMVAAAGMRATWGLGAGWRGSGRTPAPHSSTANTPFLKGPAPGPPPGSPGRSGHSVGGQERSSQACGAPWRAPEGPGRDSLRQGPANCGDQRAVSYEDRDRGAPVLPAARPGTPPTRHAHSFRWLPGGSLTAAEVTHDPPCASRTGENAQGEKKATAKDAQDKKKDAKTNKNGQV